jgi:SAM-dependent methyltransferase
MIHRPAARPFRTQDTTMTPRIRPAAVLALVGLVLAPAARAQHTTISGNTAPRQSHTETEPSASTQTRPGQTSGHHGAQTAGAQHTHGTKPDHFGRHFENAEEWAKSFDDPARDEWQKPAKVIDALQLKPGEVVADIGAGTGYFTVRLAKSPASPKVYAVDIEPSMVAYVKQRATREGLKNVVAVQAGADRTNLPEPVDLVLVVDTYHHIPNRVAYFMALKDRMKPGARLAIVDFRKDSPSGPPPEFRFTPEQISEELANAGFALQTSLDFLPRQIFLIYGVK